MPRCLLAFVLLATVGCRQVEFLNAVTPEPAQNSLQPLESPQRLDSSELTADQSAEACFVSAEELEAGGWDQEAIVAYERALQFDRTRKGIAHRLARLYARTGQAPNAIQYFQAAINETPRDAEVIGDYGYFLFEQGNFKAAESNLRSAVQLDPTNQRSRMNLGVLLASTNRVNESLQLFEQTVGPAAARFNLAVLLARSGNMAGSQQMLGEAQLLDPEMPQAAAFKAWLDGTSSTPSQPGQPSAGAASARLDW